MNRNDRLKRAAAMISVVLHRVCGDRSAGRLGSLMYHRISPHSPGLPDPPHNVTPAEFRQQISGLLVRGYRFVKLSEVIHAYRAGTQLPRRSVVLTFDDIYESVFRYAFPIMQELNVPGVAFLSTSFLDDEYPFPFDEWSCEHRDKVPPHELRPIRLEQCRQMHASGLMEFGAHSHTHQDFRNRPDDFRQDVKISVNLVRDLFDLKDVPFAFPYGSTEQGHAGGEMSRAAQLAGACCGLTTDCRLIDPIAEEPFSWGRFTAFSWDTPATLAARLAGWHSWIFQSKRWLRRVFISAERFFSNCTLTKKTPRPSLAHSRNVSQQGATK